MICLLLDWLKTRFWNYIANKGQWTNNNQDLKNLALETERFLSDALHERLTNEFVDKKIRHFIKEYNVKKSLEIRIEKDSFIFLNEKCIGSIAGFQVKIFDEKSLFKNKFLKKEISNKVKLLLEKYSREFLNNKNLNIILDKNADLYYKSKRIGSIYRGNSLFNPKIIINNNHYLNEKTYIEILGKS